MHEQIQARDESEKQKSPAPPSLDQLKNATYSGVLEHPITLKDGIYEGPPFVEGGVSRPRVTLWNNFVAYGDLDWTPGDEAAVLLIENSGGSGGHIYLAVVSTSGGQTANIATTLVGDRTEIRSLYITSHKIVMDVVEAGPQDPACCPTQLARKSYAFRNGTLKITSSEVIGTLSVAVLAGVEWKLVKLENKPLPSGVRQPTVMFEGMRIFGFGGCNNYTGNVTETTSRDITIGPLASTKMACPPDEMDMEDRFLTILQNVNRYTFLNSQLVLNRSNGGRHSILIFVPSPKNP